MSKALRVIEGSEVTDPCEADEPRKTRVGRMRADRLHTISGVIRELGRVYKRVLNDEVPLDRARLMKDILLALRERLEGNELEARLKRLEEHDT